MAAIGFGLSKTAFTSLMKQVICLLQGLWAVIRGDCSFIVVQIKLMSSWVFYRDPIY